MIQFDVAVDAVTVVVAVAVEDVAIKWKQERSGFISAEPTVNLSKKIRKGCLGTKNLNESLTRDSSAGFATTTVGWVFISLSP